MVACLSVCVCFVALLVAWLVGCFLVHVCGCIVFVGALVCEQVSSVNVVRVFFFCTGGEQYDIAESNQQRSNVDCYSHTCEQDASRHALQHGL